MSNSIGKTFTCTICHKEYVYKISKRATKTKCGTCSSKLHQEKMKLIVHAYKDIPCLDCGGKFPPWVMDFAHRDPKEKKFNIGAGLRRSLNKVLEEIMKCDVLCSNCHRIRTHDDNDWSYW